MTSGDKSRNQTINPSISSLLFLCLAHPFYASLLPLMTYVTNNVTIVHNTFIVEYQRIIFVSEQGVELL